LTDLLTFKKAAEITKSQQGTCPYTGEAPFNGAEYVRTCKLLPYLCSCSYWNKSEVYELCWTKKAEDDLLR
jgi:hypothetical protein